MKRILILCLSLLALVPLQAQRRVGVVLPFYSDTALSESMVEFYRGFLMAADSVRQGGVTLEVRALDPGTSANTLREMLGRGALDGLDMVVGPGLGVQVEPLADYCAQRQIRLFMPFNTPLPTLAQQPLSYQCVAPQEVTNEGALQLIMENFSDAHFVLLKTNSYNERGSALQAALRQMLDNYGLSYTTLNLNADEMEIDQAMKLTQRNVVVPDSPAEQALQHTIGMLTRFQNANPRYEISVIGYPEWADLVSRYSEHLHALDTYLFTTSYSNPLSGRSIRFERKYQENFGRELSAQRPSLCMMGFDLGLMILSDQNVSGPLQHGFLFSPVADGGGHVNRFVELVHYAKNKSIQIVR